MISVAFLVRISSTCFLWLTAVIVTDYLFVALEHLHSLLNKCKFHSRIRVIKLSFREESLFVCIEGKFSLFLTDLSTR